MLRPTIVAIVATMAATAALAADVEVRDYPVLRGVGFDRVEDYQVRLSPSALAVHGQLATRGQSVLDPMELESVMERASALVLSLAARHDLEPRECRHLPQLDVFQVPEWLLADRARFTHDVPPEIVLWGLYDPIIEQRGRAAILIIDHENPAYVETMLAHEIAHYWVDRLCWARTLGDDGDEEDFAKAVQVAYSRRYFGRAIQ